PLPRSAQGAEEDPDPQRRGTGGGKLHGGGQDSRRPPELPAPAHPQPGTQAGPPEVVGCGDHEIIETFLCRGWARRDGQREGSPSSGAPVDSSDQLTGIRRRRISAAATSLRSFLKASPIGMSAAL